MSQKRQARAVLLVALLDSFEAIRTQNPSDLQNPQSARFSPRICQCVVAAYQKTQIVYSLLGSL